MVYSDIPGWFDFLEIYFNAVERAPHHVPSRFVELGSFLGQSTAYMGEQIKNSNKPIDFYAVDLWAIDPRNDHNDLIKKYGRDIYIPFIKNMEGCEVQDFVMPFRDSTANAAAHFTGADIDFDFIFIDANHTYEGVKSDLISWWSLLKEGGTMAGHDIYFADVKRAVTEFFKGKGIAANLQFTPSCWIIKK